jgi:hypothetical protein
LDHECLQARTRRNFALAVVCMPAPAFFSIRKLEPSRSNKDKHGTCPGAQSTRFPTSPPSLKDGVSSGATATQCFGHHFPRSTKQEPRCETAGCRGSQTICKPVIALVPFAFCCSRGFRSRMRWLRCPLVRRPRCGTTLSIDASSISFTAQTRRKSWEEYWPLVRRSVILLDPG